MFGPLLHKHLSELALTMFQYVLVRVQCISIRKMRKEPKVSLSCLLMLIVSL